MQFNDKIRKIREDHDMTQKDLAALLNTTQRQYSRWETGQSSFPVEKLTEICRHFNVSADYVLGLQNDSALTKDEILRIENKHIH